MTLFLIKSCHELTEENILIRVGLFFRGKIPIENVKSIESVDKRPFRFGFGVYFSPFKPQIFVIRTSPNNSR